MYTELSKLDEEQFQRLTAQESFTRDGEIKKMLLVEDMIRERRNDQIRRKVEEFRQVGLDDEDAYNEAFKCLQDISIQHFPIGDGRTGGDGRFNLIVSKGSGSQAQYTVMVPAHVDTVKCDKAQLKLVVDPIDPDRRKGRGVFDMGAGVLNSIALAVDARVPEGMQVHFVFTVDEELDSVGALKLIENWPEWNNVDLILSSEIGPLMHKPNSGEKRMCYIPGRRGRLKLLGSIDVSKENTGHASIDGLPNAVEAYHSWAKNAKRAFYGSASRGIEPQRKKHDFLGGEVFDLGPVKSDIPEGFVHPSHVQFEAYVQLVPSSNITSALRQQMQIVDSLRTQKNWCKQGICHLLTKNPQRTSYDPYCMPKEHSVIKLVRETLEKISGAEPMAVPASSVADENLYAASMLSHIPGNSFENTNKGVVIIPPIGGKAHHPDEWVSWSSIRQVRSALKELIENSIHKNLISTSDSAVNH